MPSSISASFTQRCTQDSQDPEVHRHPGDWSLLLLGDSNHVAAELQAKSFRQDEHPLVRTEILRNQESIKPTAVPTHLPPPTPAVTPGPFDPDRIRGHHCHASGPGCVTRNCHLTVQQTIKNRSILGMSIHSRDQDPAVVREASRVQRRETLLGDPRLRTVFAR